VASRKQQKEAAKAARLAQEAARADAARRTRVVRLGGVVGLAVAAVVVLIVISSSGGGKSPSAKASSVTAAAVNTLLTGIPQSGTTLGSPKAQITVTEFGDLECPFCAQFAKGAENTLIANDVRAGKVKLVYRSLETATQDPTLFSTQQSDAYAAGAQDRALNFIELFYHEQGVEDSGYVTTGYLDGLAKQIPGLDYSKWQAASTSSTYSDAVLADEQAAAKAGFNSTPTIVVSGPKGSHQITSATIDYATLESAIKSAV
jgi:protein-disulfide isomerase